MDILRFRGMCLAPWGAIANPVRGKGAGSLGPTTAEAAAIGSSMSAPAFSESAVISSAAEPFSAAEAATA